MTTTSTVAAPVASRPKASDELFHLYCCDENLSLCSLDITDLQETDGTEGLCVVCDDIDRLPCLECGVQSRATSQPAAPARN